MLPRVLARSAQTASSVINERNAIEYPRGVVTSASGLACHCRENVAAPFAKLLRGGQCQLRREPPILPGFFVLRAQAERRYRRGGLSSRLATALEIPSGCQTDCHARTPWSLANGNWGSAFRAALRAAFVARRGCIVFPRRTAASIVMLPVTGTGCSRRELMIAYTAWKLPANSSRPTGVRCAMTRLLNMKSRGRLTQSAAMSSPCRK